MSTHNRSKSYCAKCGESLAVDSPGGLCPRCLMSSLVDDLPSIGDEAEEPMATGARIMPEASGSETAIPPDPLEGTQIGSYKLLQRIGEGGFGLVYMAEQVEFVQREVAINLIKAGMDTKQVIARFEAERQALTMMDHPNIAQVLEVGETAEGRPYFVIATPTGIPSMPMLENEASGHRTRKT